MKPVAKRSGTMARRAYSPKLAGVAHPGRARVGEAPELLEDQAMLEAPALVGGRFGIWRVI